MESSAPAGLAGQELNLKRQSVKSSKKTNNLHNRLPLNKSRVRVLEQIADKWYRMELYRSPVEAMVALMGDAHD
jgi:hypothetical protein